MLITNTAVRETAVAVAQALGGDWTLDLEVPADRTAHLLHSDGRSISFTPRFNGTTVQLWITGNADPTLANDTTDEEREAHKAYVAVRLPEGHRYHMAATLITEEDEEPAVIILRTLEDLLPAFDHKPRYVGHRPWIDLFDNVLAAVSTERGTTPAGTAAEQPDAGQESEGRPVGPRPEDEQHVTGVSVP
ncbi:hypothetical protein SRB5_16070 [Streptomyces sp. RB5]|uniref:Uncharacterized protein n=1 Tax=Streptomyces smaragdinus TaxID=2585196 RepID=A0A7K0CDE4_9ACTN|nr:hypothetical protein [Streptomyces smaragdinus]MQY11488.1 hypothetical protein [Streptomyces smaragdinus]